MQVFGYFGVLQGTYALWRMLGSHVGSLSDHLPHFSEEALHEEGQARASGSNEREKETEQNTAEIAVLL